MILFMAKAENAVDIIIDIEEWLGITEMQSEAENSNQKWWYFTPDCSLSLSVAKVLNSENTDLPQNKFLCCVHIYKIETYEDVNVVYESA